MFEERDVTKKISTLLYAHILTHTLRHVVYQALSPWHCLAPVIINNHQYSAQLQNYSPNICSYIIASYYNYAILYIFHSLVLSPEQGEIVVNSLKETLAQFMIKHELMNNLHFLLKGHPMIEKKM